MISLCGENEFLFWLRDDLLPTAKESKGKKKSSVAMLANVLTDKEDEEEEEEKVDIEVEEEEEGATVHEDEACSARLRVSPQRRKRSSTLCKGNKTCCVVYLLSLRCWQSC